MRQRVEAAVELAWDGVYRRIVYQFCTMHAQSTEEDPVSTTTSRPTIATREQWRAKRVELLAKEKELSRVRDELSRERRELPWVPVEEEYVFQTTEGDRTLAELFGTRSQLLVYHFMYGPDWDAGCPSCSFWMDSFDGTAVHLANRDVELTVVSLAPLDVLQTYRERMGWSFRWVSSAGSRFNHDYGVSFTEDERRDGAEYTPRSCRSRTTSCRASAPLRRTPREPSTTYPRTRAGSTC
jgi:predicted dithiol-disulfide oxidoreductase (DUF899 family)